MTMRGFQTLWFALIICCAAHWSGAASIQDLQVATGGQMVSHVSKATGHHDFIRATGSAVLSSDNVSAKPDIRALAFLRDYGAVIGLNDLERQAIALKLNPLKLQTVPSVSELRVTKTQKDNLGKTHVRLNQYYLGLPVFGAQIVVHMDNRGITAVNGHFVPGISLSAVPAIQPATAIENATRHVRKLVPDRPLQASTPTLHVYRTGLLEGFRGANVLAFAVVISAAPDVREQVWIDAATGSVLNSISLNPHAKNRLVYTPEYNASNPDLFVVRREGDPPSNVPPVDNLYDFSGEVYDMFFHTFGRDSYDGAGATMRTVYLVNNVCPNAYWNGTTTNYCPNFDQDDVVAHEWAHAYTEYTHGLIYSYQSGALNESYSDIFGETLDLLNNRDGIAGSNNAQVYPDGQRWLILEDFATGEQTLLLRDMWDPERVSNPSKVTSANYQCSPDDGGGVHTNSGVPNHAFAILVDGKTFNGQSVRGIGLNKATHIYYRAMSAYQTPSTNFAQHDQALKASCQDLIGTNVNGLFTGAPSGDVITADDCVQLEKAMLAVEMSSAPVQCNFQPQIGSNPPPVCPGNTVLFSDDFESGSLSNWTLSSSGVVPTDWPNTNWAVSSALPQAKTGSAAFAVNSKGGTCAPGGDWSGQFSMDSPAITIPSGANAVELRFDHFIESELGFDGGNVKYSVNGGPFQVVPQASFSYSGPKSTLNPVASQTPNTNPKAGEYAWHGADGGQTTGSWGTTIINVSSLAAPGDTVQFRFDFGQDGCNGVTGWFVDNVIARTCPTPPAPALSIGSGYENPDTDGSYELTWTRPEGATGPDTLQESKSACAPLLSDNAENGFALWTRNAGLFTWQNSSNKPQHSSNVFFAIMPEHTGNTSLTMTTTNPIVIPSGKTTLTFEDWSNNELDDRVSVEVSQNGTNWTEVYSSTRADLAPIAAAAFAAEPMVKRTVDLSSQAGKSIFLRFHYFVGASNYYAYSPLGWYVDNITIQSEDWKDVAETPATSYLINGRTNGTYCYRVRTSSVMNGQNVPSPYSNTVAIQVGQTPQPPAAPIQNAIQDDSTPDQQDGIDKDGRYRLSWSYSSASAPCQYRIEESGAFGTDYSDDASELLVGGANSKWTGDANWATLPHMGTGTTGYSLVYTDNLDTALTMNTPVVLPAASAALLTFDSEEDIEEGFDFGFVQVSADGAAFETVAQYTGIFSGTRAIDLSTYAGKSVRIRFKVTSDNVISFPVHFGWSIDNIRIERSANFQPIATVSGNVFQHDVTGRANGTYSYRIAGLFGDCSGNPQTGPYSDTEQITVELGPQTASPTADFVSSPNPAEQNQPVTFDASASHDNDSIGSGAEISGYQWSFGDGQTHTTTTATVQHVYTASGTFRVTLIVTDNDGETASTEQFVVVNEPPVVTRQEVSGGGNITVNGKKANFSIDVIKDGAGGAGNLQYQDKDSKFKVQSTSITSVTITGNRAVITGNCTIDKKAGYTFTVDVTDNGASGDVYSIQLSNGYQAAGPLTGGNITITR